MKLLAKVSHVPIPMAVRQAPHTAHNMHAAAPAAHAHHTAHTVHQQQQAGKWEGERAVKWLQT